MTSSLRCRVWLRKCGSAVVINIWLGIGETIWFTACFGPEEQEDHKIIEVHVTRNHSHTSTDISQAPSWSWASVNGAIDTIAHNPDYPGEYLVNIEDAHVKLATADPTGQVSGGCIQLTGRLRIISKFVMRDLIERPTFCPAPKICWDNPGGGYGHDEFWLLPVLCQSGYQGSGPYVYCLLLEPFGTIDQQNHFRRIGMLEMLKMSEDNLRVSVRKYGRACEGGYYPDEDEKLWEITIV